MEYKFLIISTLSDEVIFLKWTKSELLQAKDCTIEFEETITFANEAIARIHHLRKLQNVTVSGNIHYDYSSDLAIANLDIDGSMVLPCSITLEDVDYPFHVNSTEVYAFHKVNEDDEMHEAKGDIVELYPVLFQLIMMEVPYKVVKEGLTDYPKGKGWEVVREEDLIASKEKVIDPRLAKLRDFKIEK